MEYINQLIGAVVAAVAPFIIRAALAYAAEKQQAVMATVQQRLGAGAERVAGELWLELSSNPGVKQAVSDLVENGAARLHQRFSEEVAKRGIPFDTLRGMVAGEFGKLQAQTQAVLPR